MADHLPELTLRWSDCDQINNQMARIECRTSKLNDGFHTLAFEIRDNRASILEAIGSLRGYMEREVERLDGRDDLSEQDRKALSARVTWVGLIAGPLVGAAIKLIVDHWHLT